MAVTAADAFTEITAAHRAAGTEAFVGVAARAADTLLHIRVAAARGAERCPTVLLSPPDRAQVVAVLSGPDDGTWTDLVVRTSTYPQVRARLAVRRQGGGAALMLPYRGVRGGARLEAVTMDDAAREQLINLLTTTP